jgi:hypothetical protein
VTGWRRSNGARRCGWRWTSTRIVFFSFH